MDTARETLKTASPIELTAISVSRAAGTAQPSFYVCFADAAGPGRNSRASAVAFGQDFVEKLNAHCKVLAIRNPEADRRDSASDELRAERSLPVPNGLTDAILATGPKGSRRVDMFAQAFIFFAVPERIATVARTTAPVRLQPKHYKAALARMIAKAVELPG